MARRGGACNQSYHKGRGMGNEAWEIRHIRALGAEDSSGCWGGRSHVPARHEIRKLRVAVAREQFYAVRGHGCCSVWSGDGVRRCSHVEG